MGETTVAIGKCELCGNNCTENDFCHQCKKFVCQVCDPLDENTPIGAHSIDDHRHMNRLMRASSYHG